MTDSTPQWYDDDAGPLVRLYAMTAGRARSSNEDIDLMATVQANRAGPSEAGLSPEQHSLLRICRRFPQTVVDIASESGLPVSVVRVLLSDLLDAGYIYVTRPVRAAQLPDQRILREVINGLRAL